MNIDLLAAKRRADACTNHHEPCDCMVWGILRLLLQLRDHQDPTLSDGHALTIDRNLETLLLQLGVPDGDDSI